MGLKGAKSMLVFGSHSHRSAEIDATFNSKTYLQSLNLMRFQLVSSLAVKMSTETDTNEASMYKQSKVVRMLPCGCSSVQSVFWCILHVQCSC